MKTLACCWLIFFFFMIFVATATAHRKKPACKSKKICSENNGYCIMKDKSSECVGTLFKKGCGGNTCACCIEDTSICIAKPHCYNREGDCLGPGDWTTCTTTVDSSGCHGDGCACCRDGACQPKNECTDNNGYCFEKNSNHKCVGTESDEGCGSTSCSCCIKEPDCSAEDVCKETEDHCSLEDCADGFTTDFSGCTSSDPRCRCCKKE